MTDDPETATDDPGTATDDPETATDDPGTAVTDAPETRTDDPETVKRIPKIGGRTKETDTLVQNPKRQTVTVKENEEKTKGPDPETEKLEGNNLPQAILGLTLRVITPKVKSPLLKAA